MAIVYTTGVFDILHKGHINILAHARKLGDRVVVGIQDDDGVFTCKGAYPTLSTFERVSQMESLPFVDEVIVYSDIDQRPNLERIKPNIMVQGDDWLQSGDRAEVIKHIKEQNIRLVLIPYTQDISSSEIKRRVMQAHQRHDKEFLQNHLVVRPIETLGLYEKYEEAKVEKLIKKIEADQCFFNPITITEQDIVIDGVNRLEALKRLDARVVPCLQVAYKDVELLPNVHYKKDGVITRISEFAEPVGEKITFPRYRKEDIIQMVQNGTMVENGATWHRVKHAIVRLKIPLSHLKEGFDLESFLQTHIEKKNIRYYPHNVYICDEWE